MVYRQTALSADLKASRSGNQHGFRTGNHSAASRAGFWFRMSLSELASVRFGRSVEKRRRGFRSSAAQSPLSCASERATICSMSVSRLLADQRLVYGPSIPPSSAMIRSSRDCGYRSVDSVIRGAARFWGNHQAPPQCLETLRGRPKGTMASTATSYRNGTTSHTEASPIQTWPPSRDGRGRCQSGPIFTREISGESWEIVIKFRAVAPAHERSRPACRSRGPCTSSANRRPQLVVVVAMAGHEPLHQYRAPAARGIGSSSRR